MKSVMNIVRFRVCGDKKTNHNEVQPQDFNFVHSFRPIYYFSRIFGLMPFSIAYDMNGNPQVPRVRVIDGLWFVVSICIYVPFVYYCYDQATLARKDPSYDVDQIPVLYMLGAYLLQMVDLIYGVLIIGLDLFNRFKLVGILKKITDFDKEVMSFGIGFNYKSERRQAWLYCFVLMTISTIMTITTVFNPDYGTYSVLENAGFFGACILEDSVLFFPSISFVFLLRSLQKRFAMTNSLLRTRFRERNLMEYSANAINQNQDSMNTIKFVGRQHSFLTGVMDQLNNCYSFQMMVNIAATFMFSILTFYTFYRYVLQQNEQLEHVLWDTLKWELFYLLSTLIVIYTSDRVSSEGKMTFRIVHDIINNCSDADINASLTQLAQQVQHRYPVAMCKFFVFDWTLLFTMAAATATYLTIILKFESSRNRNS